MSNSSSSSSGIGFLGLLTIVFIVLKLIGIIHWSWWWVLSPCWLPVIALVVGLGLIALGWAISNLVKEWQKVKQ